MASNSIKSDTVAVLGGGYGGLALAGKLSIMGADVRLFEFAQFADSIAPIKKIGGIEISEQGEGRLGFAQMGLITHDIGEAIKNVNLIFIVAPAFAHDAFMKNLIPHLRTGQIVVVCTSYWASFIYGKAVQKMGAILAEQAVLAYASRRVGPTEVFIDGEKSELTIATYSMKRLDHVHTVLKQIYPHIKKADNPLETALNNGNPMLHPAIIVLNIGCIEQKEKDFPFYKAGVSTRVGKVIDSVDEERMQIAKALGAKNVYSIVDMQKLMYGTYGTCGETVYDVIKTNGAYEKIVWDYSFVMRYIEEDVPFGLVPLSALGKSLGVRTPTIDSIIEISCQITGKNYWSTGTTIERLGMAGMSVGELRKMLLDL